MFSGAEHGHAEIFSFILIKEITTSFSEIISITSKSPERKYKRIFESTINLFPLIPYLPLPLQGINV